MIKHLACASKLQYRGEKERDALFVAKSAIAQIASFRYRQKTLYIVYSSYFTDIFLGRI